MTASKSNGQSPPDFEEYDEIEGTIYQPSTIIQPQHLALHETSRIDSFVTLNCTGKVSIAEQSVIHSGNRVIGTGGFEMGRRSVVTYNCVLVTSYPDPSGPMSSMVPKEEVNQHIGPIQMGDETFIGSNAVVMPNVTLHTGSVVASGCYVDTDVPPWTIRYPNGEMRNRPGEWG